MLRLESLPTRLTSTKRYQKVLKKNYCLLNDIKIKVRFYLNSKIKTCLPRNAVGEIIPVLLATIMAIPVSKKGTVKSTTASLSEFIISDVMTMSVFLFTKSAIRPFHLPF